LTASKIESFARKLGIAPGIVVGRLQHERIVTFKQFNGLKRKVQFSEQPASSTSGLRLKTDPSAD